MDRLILCAQEWKEKLLACEAQFAEENKFGLLDMTIPAKQAKKQDATESLGGTFRKLNVNWWQHLRPWICNICCWYPVILFLCKKEKHLLVCDLFSLPGDLTVKALNVCRNSTDNSTRCTKKVHRIVCDLFGVPDDLTVKTLNVLRNMTDNPTRRTKKRPLNCVCVI